MTSDTKRDRTRTRAARLATLERRAARTGKRARKFLSFGTPRALMAGGAA